MAYAEVGIALRDSLLLPAVLNLLSDSSVVAVVTGYWYRHDARS